jgi:hypothetical protein
MAPRGLAKHRPGFHALVLIVGFIVGGFLTHFARHFLPAGAVKEFLTLGVTPQAGPLTVDLIVIKFAFTVAFDVSLLSLLGVLIAYLIARSLF